MAGGYIICEYETVKQGFPFFANLMKKLRDQLIAKAEQDWRMAFAGRRKIGEAAALGVSLNPPGPGLDVDVEKGEFGETTILPALFNGMAGTRLVSWNQWLSSTGAQTIMYGADTGHRIFEDYKIGVMGLAFLDKAIRISEIKMQVSDRKLPRMNIEEAMAYNKPAIIWEDGFILDEETGFDLYAYVLSRGYQRIKLIGLQLNRLKDKVLTTVGSALE